MLTPEGRTKKKINNLLDEYGSHIYIYMPVPGGYGKQTIDYLGCIHGVFFGIEAKRPDGSPSQRRPTARQEDTMNAIRMAGGVTFVIWDDAGVAELKKWLDSAMHMVEWSIAT
jgi:hypothetical protein